MNYNSPDINKYAGAVIYYPNVSSSSSDRGIGVCFNTESNFHANPENRYLINGYQGSTSWSGYHSHGFTGKEGNTAGGGGLDTGNEGGDEARPVNIAYRMWQRVA